MWFLRIWVWNSLRKHKCYSLTCQICCIPMNVNFMNECFSARWIENIVVFWKNPFSKAVASKVFSRFALKYLSPRMTTSSERAGTLIMSAWKFLEAISSGEIWYTRPVPLAVDSNMTSCSLTSDGTRRFFREMSTPLTQLTAAPSLFNWVQPNNQSSLSRPYAKSVIDNSL